MARVQYSALVNRMYGKLGNFIYQTFKGTDYVRTSPCVWTNPNTYRQQQIRANLAQMNQSWDSLPASHQQLWDMFASMKGCHYFGHQAYVSLNCNLLNASHADLSCISHPPLRPGTPEHVQNFCVVAISSTSTCLSWLKPDSNILYVTGHYRLHRGFCTVNPSYGLCNTVGYRPSFRFVETVRSDLKVMVHTHSYPSQTRLFYKLNSLDKFGRKSPISHAILVRSLSAVGIYYRKSHLINSASNSGTNYQIRIVVHYGSGSDSGEDVYLHGHCNNDFGDIRFKDNDGVTLLDYWIESKTDGDEAIFWVEVKDNLSSSNATIYIYYTEVLSVTTSNGSTTFLFFDDFNSIADWDIDAGSPSVLDGVLTLHNGDTLHKNYPGISGDSFRWRFNHRLQTGDDSPSGTETTHLVYHDTNNRLSHRWFEDATFLYFYLLENANLRFQRFLSGPVNANWHIFEATKSIAGIWKLYQDDSLEGSEDYDWLPSFTSWRFENARTENFYFSFVFMSKFVDPEPAHGAWGNETIL